MLMGRGRGATLYKGWPCKGGRAPGREGDRGDMSHTSSNSFCLARIASLTLAALHNRGRCGDEENTRRGREREQSKSQMCQSSRGKHNDCGKKKKKWSRRRCSVPSEKQSSHTSSSEAEEVRRGRGRWWCWWFKTRIHERARVCMYMCVCVCVQISPVEHRKTITGLGRADL